MHKNGSIALLVIIVALGAAVVQAATLTWDHNADGTASDGSGTWLNANQWVNGGSATWNNDTPDDAVIGSGGAGGTITLGVVTAATVVVDNFTGTYTLNTGPLDQSGGITVGANAGNVTFGSCPISGAGGLTVNGPSRVTIWQGTTDYTGDVVINGGGEVLTQGGNGYGTDNNITINEGVLLDRWNGTLSRDLGAGVNEVQIPGGESGLCGQGKFGLTVRINNSDSYELVWGTAYFNPSVFILQSPWANNDGNLTLRNKIDLNGTNRTIKVNKDNGTGGGFFYNGYAQIYNTIQNSDGVNPAGLIKTGPGRLIFASANTFDGGLMVSNGAVELNLAAAMPSTGAHSFHDGSELWVSLKGGDDFTAAASGAGSLGGLLTGTGPGTSTVSYTGAVDLVLRVSGSPDYAGQIPSSITDVWIFDGGMTLSGTNTYTGETIINRRGATAFTVTLGSSTALPSGTPVIIDSSNASKLDLNGYDATIGLLTLGSNNDSNRGLVTNSAAGASTLTLTNGVYVDDHNSGNGGIYCDTVDLNGATQTFQVRDGGASSDLYVSSAIQNGGLVFSALESGAGLQLAGACTYTNGTWVSDGTLTISGSLGDSTMDLSGGTVNGSGTLTFRIEDGVSDQIVMTGGTLDCSGLTVNVNGVGGGPAPGEYTIVDATGGGTISGTFAGVTGHKFASLDYPTADTVVLIIPPAAGTTILVR